MFNSAEIRKRAREVHRQLAIQEEGAERERAELAECTFKPRLLNGRSHTTAAAASGAPPVVVRGLNRHLELQVRNERTILSICIGHQQLSNALRLCPCYSLQGWLICLRVGMKRPCLGARKVEITQGSRTAAACIQRQI